MIKRFKTIINGDVTLFIKAATLAPERFQIKDESALRHTPKSEEEIEKENIAKKEENIKGYITIQNERSIYAKGFPTDKEPEKEELIKLFEPYGRVIHIKFRREEDKSFKGSIFLEYETSEMAEKAVAATINFKEEELMIMKKQDYIDMKSKEKFNGETNWNFDRPEQDRKYFLEFEGSEDLDTTKLKELFQKNQLKFGRFERLPEKGCGIVRILDDKNPDDYLKELETMDLSPLTFRLATDSARKHFWDVIEKRKQKMNSRGGRGGRGRGGRGGFHKRGSSGNNRKRGNDDNNKSKDESKEKKQKV
ncbi:unnamed protein product [Cunninghamella blakesleeana]